MSAFGADKKHAVMFEVRGPKTRNQVKAYMKRIRTVLRGLPGNIQSQSLPSAKRRRKSRKAKRRRRRTS